MSSPNNGTSAVDNIKHVVVLMFENRSFDHILGAMPGVDGLLDANGDVLPDFYNTMDPEHEPGDDNKKTWPIAIVPSSNQIGSIPTEDEKITHDFTHEFGDGMLQDLFGPGTTGVSGGQPQNNPDTTYPATNSGFLSTINYNIPESQGRLQPNGEGALTYFYWNPPSSGGTGSMKIFHTLAQAFLVCDAWYCDMPGHTGVNRAFMHCATTDGIGICDSDKVGGLCGRVKSRTIFEQVQDYGETWKMYWMDSNCDTNWLNLAVSSQQYDWWHPDAPNVNVTHVPIARFFADVQSNGLPFYSFIMCWSPGPGDTTMHPPAGVEPGENMLACIYNALRNSPCWDNTLLIVTFDENGGMYDHRSVPRTTPPDDSISSWSSNCTKRSYSFDFSILGPRIPVLLISPWLRAGFCNTQYQNTSILRFLQDSLPGADPTAPYHLTQRDLNAPSIAPVFDYAQFGCREMRGDDDCPKNMRGYGGVDPYTQFLADITPNAASLAAPPAPHIENATRGYLAPMPGHPDSDKPLTRSFATVGEMLAYASERREAALAYIRAKERR